VRGQLAAVADGKADVALGAVSLTAEREKSFDFSQPTLDAGLQIIVPVQDTHPSVPGLGGYLDLLFSRTMLIWLSAAIVVSVIPAHIFWFIERRSAKPVVSRSYFPGILQSFGWGIGSLVGKTTTTATRTFTRALAILWGFAGIVFISFYSANLSATLTVAKLDAHINGPADLYGKSVATVADTTASTFLRSMGIDATETKTIDESYRLLREEGYDAVVFDAPALRYYVAHRGEGVAVLAGPVFQEEDQGFVFRIDSPLRKPVNQTLFRMREDGTYNLIKEKWFGDDIATTAGDLNSRLEQPPNPHADFTSRERLVAAGGQMRRNGLVDARRRDILPQVPEQQRHRHHRRRRVGDALAGDVGCTAVNRFEHRRIRPGGVDIAAGRQPDSATYRRCEIGDDVAEQVVGDDDIESSRVGHHEDGGGVDVLVADLNVGELGADLGHGARPQPARERQHVGLVHQRQMLAPLLSPGECVTDDAAHTEGGVQAHLGGDLVGCADPDGAPGSRVGALGALTDDDEIDLGVARQWAAHPLVEPARAQVDVVVELETDLQQQATLQHPAGHRGVADRAEQDRVVAAQLVEHRRGQHLSGGVVAAGAEVVLGLVHPG